MVSSRRRFIEEAGKCPLPVSGCTRTKDALAEQYSGHRGGIVGELYNSYRQGQDRQKRQQQSDEATQWELHARCLPILAREAVARIKQNGRYNTSHHGDWKNRVVTLNWRGGMQLGWNVRPLLPPHATPGDKHFIALVETAELLYVINQRNGQTSLQPFDPSSQRLDLSDLGSTWAGVVAVVDDPQFEAARFPSLLDDWTTMMRAMLQAR